MAEPQGGLQMDDAFGEQVGLGRIPLILPLSFGLPPSLPHTHIVTHTHTRSHTHTHTHGHTHTHTRSHTVTHGHTHTVVLGAAILSTSTPCRTRPWQSSGYGEEAAARARPAPWRRAGPRCRPLGGVSAAHGSRGSQSRTLLVRGPITSLMVVVMTMGVYDDEEKGSDDDVENG